jgi:hypothetical protein
VFDFINYFYKIVKKCIYTSINVFGKYLFA